MTDIFSVSGENKIYNIKKIKGTEDRQTASEVFDKSTLLTLYSLANSGVIDTLHGVIKTGKESNVLFALGKGGRSLAVKIHRTSTSNYKSMLRYLDGDYRFKGIKKSRRSIVYSWVKKEFKNLAVARECGVSVPRLIAYKNNVLVMSFIGERGIPAPMLKNSEVKNPEELFDEIVGFIKALYCVGGIIHSDLSEYNILIKNKKPIFIDLSHAVVKQHPMAQDFLKRDVSNIARFFRKYMSIDESKTLEFVKEC